jgi:quercetin dioxygenase-like cupin family protein
MERDRVTVDEEAGFSRQRYDARKFRSPKNKEDNMKALVRVSSLVLIGLIAALTLTAAGGRKAPVVWAAGDVKWMESPATKGLSVAPLWGDPSKGAYGALKKVAGGTDLGWHTHSFDQKVVAISGTFDFQVEGQSPKELSTGSYVSMPRGVKHTAKCREGADCVYFEESPGKSDYKPATAPAM